MRCDGDGQPASQPAQKKMDAWLRAQVGQSVSQVKWSPLSVPPRLDLDFIMVGTCNECACCYYFVPRPPPPIEMVGRSSQNSFDPSPPMKRTAGDTSARLRWTSSSSWSSVSHGRADEQAVLKCDRAQSDAANLACNSVSSQAVRYRWALLLH